VEDGGAGTAVREDELDRDARSHERVEVGDDLRADGDELRVGEEVEETWHVHRRVPHPAVASPPSEAAVREAAVGVAGRRPCQRLVRAPSRHLAEEERSSIPRWRVVRVQHLQTRNEVVEDFACAGDREQRQLGLGLLERHSHELQDEPHGDRRGEVRTDGEQEELVVRDDREHVVDSDARTPGGRDRALERTQQVHPRRNLRWGVGGELERRGEQQGDGLAVLLVLARRRAPGQEGELVCREGLGDDTLDDVEDPPNSALSGEEPRPPGQSELGKRRGHPVRVEQVGKDGDRGPGGASGRGGQRRVEVAAIVVVVRAPNQKQAGRGDLERVGVARAEDLGLGDDGATQNGGRDGRRVGEGGEHDIERGAQPLGADHVHIDLKGSHLVGEGEGAGG
jgi:hypothetical protein